MEDIRFVISELNKNPFNKKLNVISYDTLRSEQRFEILFQIFKEIDNSISIESFQVANIEEVIAHVLETLRIFKYTPPSNMTPSEFRENLILGEKSTFTHIFVYLFQKMPELKKRAYLARYLVKIAVSPDVEGDNDIVQLYAQYDQLIENFKTIHMTYENLKASVESVQEVQKDIKAMEDEKEQVIEKLNNIKRKVDIDQNPQLFSCVRTYKEEKDKNEKMLRQKMQQEAELQNLTHLLSKLTNEMKEFENTYKASSSSEELFDRLNDELDTKRQLVKDVLPKELESIQKHVQDLQEIDTQSSLGSDYLEKINQQMQAINKEINTIMEKRMLNNEMMDDKLVVYRQNATSVAQKRATVQQKLEDIEKEYNELRQTLREKKNGPDGDEVLRGDSLKQYVVTLRNKGNVYKQKRQELSELRTEVGIYVRTEELLKAKEKSVSETLSKLEDQRGITGYFTMREEDNEQFLREEQEQNLEQLSTIVRDLNATISERKAKIAPFIKDLRPLRQKHQDLQQQCEQKKALYDSCAIGLESKVEKLRQELKQMCDEFNDLESQNFLLNCKYEVLQAKRALLEDEMKRFVSNDADEKANSFIEKLQREINAETAEEKNLKAKGDELKENEHEIKRQLKMWNDLQSLLEIKSRIATERKANKSDVSQARRDHLIL